MFWTFHLLSTSFPYFESQYVLDHPSRARSYSTHSCTTFHHLDIPTPSNTQPYSDSICSRQLFPSRSSIDLPLKLTCSPCTSQRTMYCHHKLVYEWQLPQTGHAQFFSASLEVGISSRVPGSCGFHSSCTVCPAPCVSLLQWACRNNFNSMIHQANQNCNVPVVCGQQQSNRIEREYIVSRTVDDEKVLPTNTWDSFNCQTLWFLKHGRQTL